MRIGIFGGTFDPVHTGHVQFALKAAHKVQLDKVCFLVERKPRNKQDVTDYEHRVNMTNLATKPYHKLETLELPDKQLSVNTSLSKLQKLYPKSELFVLVGSDVAKSISKWPNIKELLTEVSLIVGLRKRDYAAEIEEPIKLIHPSAKLYFIYSPKPSASASRIRAGSQVAELNEATLEYIEKYGLYLRK